MPSIQETTRASRLIAKLAEIEQAAFVLDVSWLNHRLCRSERAESLWWDLVHTVRELGDLERRGALEVDQIDALRAARVNVGTALGGIYDCGCVSCRRLMEQFVTAVRRRREADGA
jgi:hypothetical protein